MTECDGIAALRRSFIGALVNVDNAGERFINQRMMAAPRRAPFVSRGSHIRGRGLLFMQIMIERQG